MEQKFFFRKNDRIGKFSEFQKSRNFCELKIIFPEYKLVHIGEKRKDSVKWDLFETGKYNYYHFFCFFFWKFDLQTLTIIELSNFENSKTSIIFWNWKKCFLLSEKNGGIQKFWKLQSLKNFLFSKLWMYNLSI